MDEGIEFYDKIDFNKKYWDFEIVFPKEYDLNEWLSYIYLIYNDDNEIIYIGRTNNILSRLNEHFRKKIIKNAHKARMIRAERKIIREIEKILIDKYKPFYNSKKRGWGYQGYSP